MVKYMTSPIKHTNKVEEVKTPIAYNESSDKKTRIYHTADGDVTVTASSNSEWGCAYMDINQIAYFKGFSDAKFDFSAPTCPSDVGFIFYLIDCKNLHVIGSSKEDLFRSVNCANVEFERNVGIDECITSLEDMFSSDSFNAELEDIEKLLLAI